MLDAGSAARVAEGCEKLKLGAPMPTALTGQPIMGATQASSFETATAMAVTPFSSCRGPSPALFIVRRI